MPDSSAEIFTRIYRENGWGSPESRSGPGSTRQRAADFSADLLDLLRALGVDSLLDAGCGDFGWASIVADAVPRYIGLDVVPEVIEHHRAANAAPGRTFMSGDLATAALPCVDLILCRDCLVHLSFEDALRALRNFEQSGSTYLLATTFVDRASNKDVPTGGWRVLNLEAPPFNLPRPVSLIDERCTHTGGIYRDKRLGLWKLR